MFDESKQSDNVPKSRVNAKQKINMKKMKVLAPSEPPLRAQFLGNGLKKPKSRLTTCATKRKIAEKDIGRDLSLKHETDISEHSISKKRKHDDTEIKNKSMKECNSGHEIKIQNHDIDKLDEIILDAKRKEYDEKFKNDHDIEDILFHENIDDSKKCNEVVNEKCETELVNYVKKTKKKKKKLNESNDSEVTNVNAETNVDKTNVIAENNMDKTNAKAENNVNKTNAKAENNVKKTNAKAENNVNKTNAKAENNVNKTNAKAENNVNKTNAKAENNVNKTNAEAENNVNKTNAKAENNVNKESATNIKDPKLNPYDQKRKDKLRKVLEIGNRNNIKANGNKLRDRMLERLKAAKFRYLNEKLYTSSGSEAQELFQSDPEAFQIYHEGYQQQLKKWPVNPLDLIIERIKKMPASHVIADMGCGTGALAARVPHTVHSFDLVASAPGVRACDMAHTPLLAGAVDVAVYCLALMGTQLTQYLLEANRILKIGGTLLIAEVESRFTDAEAFARALSRLGFQLSALRRHRVFLVMELSKTGAPRRGRQPELTLKPCLYKKR